MYDDKFRWPKYSTLALSQLMMPPFRAETGVPPEAIPVYAALNPIIPPGEPYRTVNPMPAFSRMEQWEKILGPENMFFWGG